MHMHTHTNVVDKNNFKKPSTPGLKSISHSEIKTAKVHHFDWQNIYTNNIFHAKIFSWQQWNYENFSCKLFVQQNNFNSRLWHFDLIYL